jgi:2-oxoglutarate ferredoxin oxidoreductase subunit gamma
VNRLEVRLSGFGGQGIIRSGEIVGKAAAIYDGRYATFTQSYGPESRGGACAAQVAIADDPVELSYPHVIDPSILVLMSQGAYNRYIADFRRDGLLIVDEGLVELDGRAEGLRVLKIPATRLAEELGRRIGAQGHGGVERAGLRDGAPVRAGKGGRGSRVIAGRLFSKQRYIRHALEST